MPAPRWRPTNPRLENLAWGTKVENEADKELHGTVPRGDRNGSGPSPIASPAASALTAPS